MFDVRRADFLVAKLIIVAMKWRQTIAVLVIALIVDLCLAYGLIAILPVWLAAPLVWCVVAVVVRAEWQFVPLLVLTGFTGVVMVAYVHQRLGLFLTALVLVPLVAFLFFGSTGRDLMTSSVPGYWGMLVVPIALALTPVAVSRALWMDGYP